MDQHGPTLVDGRAAEHEQAGRARALQEMREAQRVAALAFPSGPQPGRGPAPGSLDHTPPPRAPERDSGFER